MLNQHSSTLRYKNVNLEVSSLVCYKPLYKENDWNELKLCQGEGGGVLHQSFGMGVQHTMKNTLLRTIKKGSIRSKSRRYLVQNVSKLSNERFWWKKIVFLQKDEVNGTELYHKVRTQRIEKCQKGGQLLGGCLPPSSMGVLGGFLPPSNMGVSPPQNMSWLYNGLACSSLPDRRYHYLFHHCKKEFQKLWTFGQNKKKCLILSISLQ